MFYIKTKVNDDIELKVNLYADEIFTQCPKCGIEFEVEPDLLAGILSSGGDFAGTRIYCKFCSED